MGTTSQADRVSARDSSDSGRAIDELAALWLEVRHPNGQESAVMVGHDRCSLGGRADCTVRLNHGENRVDCLIIRGPSGVVARNWSGFTSLNGRAFRDARLQIGDLLQIAGTNVRLLSGEPVTPARTELMAASADSSPSAVDSPLANDEFVVPTPTESMAGFASLERYSRSTPNPTVSLSSRDVVTHPRDEAVDAIRRAELDSSIAAESSAPTITFANEQPNGTGVPEANGHADGKQSPERDPRELAIERDRRRRLIVRLRHQSQRQQRERIRWTRVRSRLERRILGYSRLAVRLQDRIHVELRPRLEELELKRVQLEQRAGDLEAIQTQLNTAHEELQRRLRYLADQEDDFRRKERQLNEREQELVAKEVELLQRCDLVEVRAAELTAREDEIAQQRESLERERQSITDARAAEIAQLTAALDQKQCFLTEAQQALDVERGNLQSREAAIEAESTQLRQECADAVQELNSVRDELADVQLQLQQERDTHSRTTGRLSDVEQQVRELEAALKDATGELEQFTSQVADINERNLALQHEHCQLRETIEKLENAGSTQRATWERERSELQTEIERYRELGQSSADEPEFGQATQRNHELELERRRAEWDAERQRYEHVIEQLELAKSGGLDQLQATQQELAEQSARWSDERATWERERAALQEEIERNRQQSSVDEAEVGQVTQRNHELELELRRAEWEEERQRYQQTIEGLENAKSVDHDTWDQERRSLQTEIEQHRQAAAAFADEQYAPQPTLQRHEIDLEIQRSEWDLERQRYEQTIEQLRTSWEQERSALQAEIEQHRQAAAAFADEQYAPQQTMQRQELDLELQRSGWDADRQRLEQTIEQLRASWEQDRSALLAEIEQYRQAAAAFADEQHAPQQTMQRQELDLEIRRSEWDADRQRLEQTIEQLRASWEQDRSALLAEIEQYRQAAPPLAGEHHAPQQTMQRQEIDLEMQRSEWDLERQRYEQAIAQLEHARSAENEQLQAAQRELAEQLTRSSDERVSWERERSALQAEIERSRQFVDLSVSPGFSSTAMISGESLQREFHEQELQETVRQLEERLQHAEKQRQEWENEREQLVTAYEQQINEITNLIGELQGQASREDVPHAAPTATVSCVVDCEAGIRHDTNDQPPLDGALPNDAEDSLDVSTLFAKYGINAAEPESDTAQQVDGRSNSPEESAYYDDARSYGDDDPSLEQAEHTDHQLTATEVGDESDHRESIESYMTRLLGQLPSEWAVENAKANAPENDTPDKSLQPAQEAEAIAPPKEVVPREKPSLPPKRLNPLAATDLSAMRELAVTSSRLAIQQYKLRTTGFWIGSGVAKILIAVLAGLIVSVAGRSFHESLGWLGIACVPVALILAYRHFIAPLARRI